MLVRDIDTENVLFIWLNVGKECAQLKKCLFFVNIFLLSTLYTLSGVPHAYDNIFTVILSSSILSALKSLTFALLHQNITAVEIKRCTQAILFFGEFLQSKYLSDIYLTGLTQGSLLYLVHSS